MRRFFPSLIIVVLLPLHLFLLSTVSCQKKNLPKGGENWVVIPSPVLRVTSIGFEGLVSDVLFLKALTFYGAAIERKGKVRVSESEWRWLYNILTASTDLDPYFFDPYYFANANLTWEGHLVKETNSLLAKGAKFRDWDWWMPFYMGFNEFYFLQDHSKASEYLMSSAERPGAPSLLSSLATRLAYKAKRTENAIIFVRATLKATKDKATRKEMETRLTALERIVFLEKAIKSYRDRFGREPLDLGELQKNRILEKIPDDPYGGAFYIAKDGSVKTTSNMYYVQNQN